MKVVVTRCRPALCCGPGRSYEGGGVAVAMVVKDEGVTTSHPTKGMARTGRASGCEAPLSSPLRIIFTEVVPLTARRLLGLLEMAAFPTSTPHNWLDRSVQAFMLLFLVYVPDGENGSSVHKPVSRPASANAKQKCDPEEKKSPHRSARRNAQTAVDTQQAGTGRARERAGVLGLARGEVAPPHHGLHCKPHESSAFRAAS